MPDGDTPITERYPDAPTPQRTISAGHALARALDVVLFEHPFFIIDAGNARVGKVVRTLGDALVAVRRSRRGVAVVGTLTSTFRAVDLDLRHGVDPMLGEVALNLLVTWCVDRQLRYQVRESGRPGHAHLIVQLGDEPEQVAALQRRCTELQNTLPVTLGVRRALRLLRTAHRNGLPSRLLGGTLLPDHVDIDPDRDLYTPTPSRGSGSSTRPREAVDQQRSTERSAAAGGRDDELNEVGAIDDSASAGEYGAACAMVRAGFVAAEAWARTGECQVAGRGYGDWLRFIWSKALVTVGAESGQDEAVVWARIERDCRAYAERTGVDQWRATRWEPALQEALTDRPRRLRVPARPGDRPRSAAGQSTEDTAPEDQAAEAARAARRAEVELLRVALRTAAVREVGLRGCRPQVAESMGAVLDTLAEEIVAGGRISQRRLALDSRVSRSTAQLRLREAQQAGLIRIVASYRADGQTCDVYALGPVTQGLVEGARETRSRSCTPPLPRLLGHADPHKMRIRHQAERVLYSAPAMSSVDTEKIETAYSDVDSPARPLVKSRMRQRQWWAGLTEAEQEQRREACRARLDAMTQADRDTWIQWLARRDLIDGSIDRVLDGTAEPVDLRVVERAPLTVHHGRQDPRWREGGTPPRQAASTPQRAVQGALSLDVTPAATAKVSGTRKGTEGTTKLRRGLTSTRPATRTPQQR